MEEIRKKNEHWYDKEGYNGDDWAYPISSRSYLNWKVEADLGETDQFILPREADGDYEHGGAKPKSGWKNPHGFTDAGSDDDLVLFQMKEDGSIKRHHFRDPFFPVSYLNWKVEADLGEAD